MQKGHAESLRICFVSQKFPIFDRTADCGYLWPLAQKIAGLGHEVNVITPDPSIDKIQRTPSRMFFFRLSPFRDSALDTIEQILLERSIDLVHSVDNTGLPIALHKKSLKVAFASDVKGTHLDSIFGLWALAEETVSSYLKTSTAILNKYLRSFFGDDHNLIKHSDAVFVSSQEQLDILERYYRYPSSRTFIIPFGIDAAAFEANRESSKDVFVRLGVPEGHKVILTVTPFIHVEETKNLISAFERVAIKKPNTALVIVGEGPHRKELEAHMLNLALASKVWFFSPDDPELVDLMIQNCDTYVNLYSKSSGFEATVLEAMAAEKTVIASEVGTSRQMIDRGVDGFLLRPTEIHALSGLLLQIVSEQIDTKVIGERARRKILKLFDNNQMVEQTIQAYRQIIKNKR